MCEQDPVTPEGVQVRCVYFTAEYAEVGIPQVVRNNQQHVRLICLLYHPAAFRPLFTAGILAAGIQTWKSKDDRQYEGISHIIKCLHVNYFQLIMAELYQLIIAWSCNSEAKMRG